MERPGIRSTLGCVAAGGAVLVLWLLLAGDAAPFTMLSGLVVAAAVAAWAGLIES